MTVKKLRVTPRQIGRLVDAVRSVPSHPVGDHLTEDQFVAYSMDPPELSDDVIGQMDAHFASCDACAGRMEHLLEVSEAWRGEAGQRRLANLSLRIRSGAGLGVAAGGGGTESARGALESLHALIGGANSKPYGAALPAAAAAPLRVPDPSKRGALTIRDDANFNLHVAISVLEPSLKGTRITIDPFGTSLVLEETTPDEVAGKAFIPKSARRELPKGSQVKLRLDPAEPL